MCPAYHCRYPPPSAWWSGVSSGARGAERKVPGVGPELCWGTYIIYQLCGRRGRRAKEEIAAGWELCVSGACPACAAAWRWGAQEVESPSAQVGEQAGPDGAANSVTWSACAAIHSSTVLSISSCRVDRPARTHRRGGRVCVSTAARAVVLVFGSGRVSSVQAWGASCLYFVGSHDAASHGGHGGPWRRRCYARVGPPATSRRRRDVIVVVCCPGPYCR